MHSLTSTELSSQTKYTPCNHRTSPRHQPLNLEIGCFKYVCVRVASPPLPTPQEAFGRRNVETCQRNSWLVYSQRLGFCWVLGHPHLPQHVQGEPADSILSVFRKWMATPSSRHQPVHFSFFCLGSGSRCTQPWVPLYTAEACRICSSLPKQRCWRISERPHCTKRKWMGRTLILEGWHCWHAVLGDILFAELLTLHGLLFQAAMVSSHLFHFPVSWFAFRNPHCSRKGTSITRFSGKILWNVFSFSQLCVHVLLSSLVICPHSLVWWHFWKPTRDGGKI